MSSPVHSFAERHPDYKEAIKEMAEKNSAFGGVCERFGRLWDSLNELENEPVDTERLRREVGHLEREMLAMVHDQMRV
jgi:hypothetical protein